MIGAPDDRTLYEVVIRLQGNVRADGSRFVTSENVPYFSAVLSPNENWDGVFSHLAAFLNNNHGIETKSMRVVEDASNVFGEQADKSTLPFVLAELAKNSAHSM